MPQVPGTPPSQLAGKKRKRSRWSDAPPSAPPPSESKTSSGGGAATSTNDDALIATAMASLGEPSSSLGPQPQPVGQAVTNTGGQQFSQEQLMQIKEQIAVQHVTNCKPT